MVRLHLCLHACKVGIQATDKGIQPLQLGQLVGASMLIASTAVFLYYTIWTLVMVSPTPLSLQNPTQIIIIIIIIIIILQQTTPLSRTIVNRLEPPGD